MDKVVYRELPSESEDFVLLPFKNSVYVDLSNLRIHKVRGEDIRAEVDQYRSLLERSGLRLGPTPEYYYDPKYGFVEENPIVAGIDGQTFLLSASESDAIQFYTSVILDSLFSVLDYQGRASNLGFSIDSIPHNFVDGAYIDYFPYIRGLSDSRILYTPKLISYVLARVGRSRPELFTEFCDIMLSEMRKRRMSDALEYMKSRDYIALRGLVNPLSRRTQIVHTLENIGNIDDLLGISILLVSGMKDYDILDAMKTLDISQNRHEQVVSVEREKRLRDGGIKIEWTYELSDHESKSRFLIEELFFNYGIKYGTEEYRKMLKLLASQ